MSDLWKKWYKVDELHVEIRDLKKKVKELESDNRQLNLKVQNEKIFPISPRGKMKPPPSSQR